MCMERRLSGKKTPNTFHESYIHLIHQMAQAAPETELRPFESIRGRYIPQFINQHFRVWVKTLLVVHAKIVTIGVLHCDPSHRQFLVILSP